MKDSVLDIHHSEDESLYGHLSNINCKETPNLDDYEKYPNLNKANPTHFTIRAGEALIIPKKWWHYVKTYESCYFVNFWTDQNIGEEPKLVKHDIKFNYESIDPTQRVSIWCYSEGKSDIEIRSFGRFIKDKKPLLSSCSCVNS